MNDPHHFLSKPNPVTRSAENIVRPDRSSVIPRALREPARARGTVLVIAIMAVIGTVATAVMLWRMGAFGRDDPFGGWLALFCLFLAVGTAMWAGVAARAVHRERSILREVFHGSRSARLVTDIARRPLLWNDAFADLCQSFEDETDGVTIKPGLAGIRAMLAPIPESLERFEILVELAARGTYDRIEVPAGGGVVTRWLKIEAQPVPGWIGALHWRLEDFTDRHELDEAIRSEHEKLIDFTDNAPVGFFSVNEDGRFLFMNTTLARWLGTDIESLMTTGRLHNYLVEPPVDAKPYDIVPEGGAKQVAEVRMKGPGGRVFLASINQSVVHEGESAVRTRGVVHDLTFEREMRQALKESEDRFQRFFAEAPVGVALLDKHSVLSDCNPALGNILGMRIEAVEGREFSALVAEKDRARVAAALERIEEGSNLGAPMEITLKGETKDIVVQMHARSLKGGSAVVHIIDLTEQKSLEAQFTQSQKMQAVGQLAGGVAHDFNNLLTAMIGFCDLLLLRHKAGDPSFADIMQIKQNANRAANLVRQLLAFSRQQTLQPRILDITETLTELSHLMRRLIGVRIEMEFVHDPSIGLVKVDEGQLEQVLINLVVNARDAMDGQGRLTIHTENVVTDKPMQRGADSMPAGNWVRVGVSDTGCGIPKENLARIFEPFFTTKPIGSGTGLGLATVYGIVRQTGGYVHVDSMPGKGTTFSVYLPRHESDTTTVAAAKETAEKGQDLTGTATILLVEDEDAVRMFSTRALTNKGYQVLEAASGEAALEIIEAQGDALNLIVSDVIMPEMDGPTLIARVREKYPDLPVIFVSGYTEDRFKEQFGPNTHFLPKPFTLQQLATKVKDVLSAT